MTPIPRLKLSTGDSLPQLGFGTYRLSPDIAERAVNDALEVGYRHIDTAQMYHNEAEVGAAWAGSGLDRSELFLTTKLDNGNHLPADARSSFADSLKKLRTDYVDLFLIHWPLPTLYEGDFVKTWETLIEFFNEGRARAIGVSNFEIPHLAKIITATGFIPHTNQIEAHPYLPNNAVHEFNRSQGIITEAWSPLAQGTLLRDDTLVKLAETLERSPAQIALRWAIERGDVVFPKSIDRTRMEQNLNIFDFQLDDATRDSIDLFDRGEAGRIGFHPNTMDKIL